MLHENGGVEKFDKTPAKSRRAIYHCRNLCHIVQRCKTVLECNNYCVKTNY